MIDRSIVIQNVYVMLAYAFRAINTKSTSSVNSEKFDNLHDLLAEILIRGMNSQIKRGLHQDYLSQTEELSTVRGRIDIAQTVNRHARTRGRIVCSFDEYLPDTSHNQALKSVISLLVRRGKISKVRQASLRRLLPYLEEVALVSPTSIRWNELHYHRANASYRLLLGVCELIVLGLLPNEDNGNTKLESWFSEEAMSTLYERFLREYFVLHHPELSPSAPLIDWALNDGLASGLHQLPTMRTDLTLRKGANRLIIDAKYYGKSMQTNRFNAKSTVNSAHLYQILNYVKNEDVAQTGNVTGLLLYAKTEAYEQPELDVVIQGNRIGAQTLDLSRPWMEVRTQLDALTQWIPKS